MISFRTIGNNEIVVNPQHIVILSKDDKRWFLYLTNKQFYALNEEWAHRVIEDFKDFYQRSNNKEKDE